MSQPVFSQTYSILIVDDEPLSRQLIREYLSTHSNITIIGEADGGKAAVTAIETLQPDLILLDIHLPQLNGFEVLEVSGRTKGVIFSTAYDQYAIKAFDLHAIDYLLKPYSQTRFDQAITRAIEVLNREQKPMNDLLKDAAKSATRITVKDRDQIHIIPIEEITYVTAEDDYVRIHWGNKSVLKTQSLTELESQLDKTQFVRIHRSHLVKAEQIIRIERATQDSQVAVLKDGTKLPASRSGLIRMKELSSNHLSPGNQL